MLLTIENIDTFYYIKHKNLYWSKIPSSEYKASYKWRDYVCNTHNQQRIASRLYKEHISVNREKKTIEKKKQWKSAEQTFSKKGNVNHQWTYQKTVNFGGQEYTNHIPFYVHAHAHILNSVATARAVETVEH